LYFGGIFLSRHLIHQKTSQKDVLGEKMKKNKKNCVKHLTKLNFSNNLGVDYEG
jgi:hypothetical protein